MTGLRRFIIVIAMVSVLTPPMAQSSTYDVSCPTTQVTRSPVGAAQDTDIPPPITGERIATLSADLTSVLHGLPAGAVSTTISTYGRPVTTDAIARAGYAKLAAGSIVRIPIQWNSGNPCSSAAGGPQNISADNWIRTILAMGARPMIVIGGSADNNFSARDAASLVRRYRGSLYGVVIGNEPDNNGMRINDYITRVFKPAALAIRAADPTVKIAGPAQASYRPNDLRTFINDCRGLYDIIDFHHYGTGTNAPGDSDLMAIASTYESDVAAIRAMLSTAGQTGVEVQVGEFNLSWQYYDGIAGGDQRFFSSYNTAWSASVVGHILRGGGRAIAYSQQNGALGLMVEPGNNDGGHVDGTPQPIYYGLAAFQGMGLFRGFGNAIMKSASAGNVDCFAGSSGNIVLVNRTDATVTANLTITGAQDGISTVWESNVDDPYAAPAQSSINISAGNTSIALRPYQVVTILANVTAASGPTS